MRELAAVDIRIEARDEGAVPLTLVKSAVEQRQRAEKERGEIDEFWCVFDVEWPQNHPHLPEALDLARRNSIEVAVSNPCFEIWLVLHFEHCARSLTNAEAVRLRHRYDNAINKGLDASLYMPVRAAARAAAEKLEVMHEQNGTNFPNNNPSSGMSRLLASVDPKNTATNSVHGFGHRA